jgi:nucleotide-binding universal stress UspA family protein
MFKKILVPLDGSKEAERALGYARQLASLCQARLILAACLSSGGFSPVGNEMDLPLKEGHRYLSELQQGLQASGITAEVCALEGDPADTILNQAKLEHVDLILQTSHGRTGLSRLLLGSVAEKVMRYAPCPVMVVRLDQEDSNQDWKLSE